MIDEFPLQWPDHVPRTPPESRAWGGFKITPDQATRDLVGEVQRSGGSGLVISSNRPVRRDGLPMSSAREPEDPGVAVYFTRKGQQVRTARAALRSPDLYSDDELRDFCATLQSRWGDATDYCQADAMIFALNKREFIARNCPRPETSRDVLMGMRDRWGEILIGAGIGGVVLLKLTGWL